MKLKPLAPLLSVCLTSPALAIGLGDLSVRSYLGQPLHVTVEILGPPATLTAECFSLRPADGGLALPGHARFSIERQGESALLHITTTQAFSDPIGQFILASDCEGRLQREYVLLLDPPLTVEPVGLAGTGVAPDARNTANVAPSVPDTAVAAAPATLAPAARPHPRPASKPQRSAAPKAVVQEPAPRLVISGRAGAPTAGPADPALPLSLAELSDENTALLRKLAHIEAQLVALQQQNAELEARLVAASQAAPAPAAKPAPEWPIYSLGLIGLLAGSGALVSWMRRRDRHPRRTLMEQTLWTSLKPIKPVIARPVVGPVPSARKPLPQNDSLLVPPAPPGRDIEEFSLSAAVEGTEIREDVLDQAEVFVLHGQPKLAIHLLREHLRSAPDESPAPWLLLLDLLHREQDTAGYAEASAECRRHFNVSFAAHPVPERREDSPGLLAYPHILDLLSRAWNTPELDAVFQDLIYDRRGGVRVGFEAGAYQDILLLRAVAKESLQLAA